MNELLEPLRSESLKDLFVARFEELILSGQIKIGQKLPPERELALKLGVSRPVVHEGLLDLAARGLVSMKPRHGAWVNDYRRSGSITMLESLFNYHAGALDADLIASLLQMRQLLEIEFAVLAARNRTAEQLKEFEEILAAEELVDRQRVGDLVELDFRFHHQVALSSGNLVYPMMMNSLKPVYTNFTGVFFTDTAVVGMVFSFHARLFDAVAEQDESMAIAVMRLILDHGQEHLNSMLEE